jgi:hypothetical protein
MYEDDDKSDDREETSADPAARAAEKVQELKMHAEFAGIYEGFRKFGCALLTGLDFELVRTLQKGMLRFEKAKVGETPVLEPELWTEATDVLSAASRNSLSLGDYHIHRRPGEVMMVRWLRQDAGSDGADADTFYKRLQAHFDAGLEGTLEDERQALGWKGDKATKAYLEKLEGEKVDMAGRYIRDALREHGLFALNTTAADEMNIQYLAEHLMGLEIAELVGKKSAPEDPTDEGQLAWFFKLYALRGMVEGKEHLCFFTYLQKTAEDDFEF